MVPPTQYDANKNISLGRDKGKHTFRLMRRSANTGTAMTTGILADKLTFGEDFVLEHSAPRRPIALIKMAGDPGSARKDMQHSPQAYGFPC